MMPNIHVREQIQKRFSYLGVRLHTGPAPVILIILIILFCLLVFRLGVKSGSLSESDIINHYSNLYLEDERGEGRDASMTDCYALALGGLFERLEVICEPSSAPPYHYVISYWGQLLRVERRFERQLERSI